MKKLMFTLATATIAGLAQAAGGQTVDWSDGVVTAGAGVDVVMSAELTADKTLILESATEVGGISATNTARNTKMWIISPSSTLAGTAALSFVPGEASPASVVDVSEDTTLKTGLFTSGKPIWKTGPGMWHYAETSFNNQFMGNPVVVKDGVFKVTTPKASNAAQLLVTLDSSGHNVEFSVDTSELKTAWCKVVVPEGEEPYKPMIHRTGSASKQNAMTVEFHKDLEIKVDSADLLATGSWTGDANLVKTGPGGIQATGTFAVDGEVRVQQGTFSFGESGSYNTKLGTVFRLGTSEIASTSDVYLRFSTKAEFPANYSIVVDHHGRNAELGIAKSRTSTTTVRAPIELKSDVIAYGNNTAASSGIVYAGVISGPGRMILKSHSNCFNRLSAGNTYKGGTTLQEGTCQVASDSALGVGDVSIGTGARLVYTGNFDAIANTASIAMVADAMIDFGNTETCESVKSMTLDGATAYRGKYGAVGSGARYEVDWISGKGTLEVLEGRDRGLTVSIH